MRRLSGVLLLVKMMKVVNVSDWKRIEGISDLFVGGAVDREQLIDDKTAIGVKVTMIKFSPGARTKWHTHTSEQILWVTEGRGIVANEKGEHIIIPGIIVYIPPGERHWHGAASDTPLAHLSVTTPGVTKIEE